MNRNRELPKGYSPDAMEEKWYAAWMQRGLFDAEVDPSRPAFSIVIPPPNVTGSLHMGHAFNNTFQDILCRARRMQGFNVLWLPGTDHAGIATQNVVEKSLAAKGLSATTWDARRLSKRSGSGRRFTATASSPR